MKVLFRRDPKGAHQGLDTTSQEGTLTRMSFRIAAKPEMLDGGYIRPCRSCTLNQARGRARNRNHKPRLMK
jgi:hypothetical protein